MSVAKAEPSYLPDITNLLPKWFKHTRSIKCGRKIICIDQLYGWRGMDTGYYGSEEMEEEPDFLDEVKNFHFLPVQNEVKEEQLKSLRKESVKGLQKERGMHPNFNILTDRAPTPDFSVTYIETSYNTDDESANKTKGNVNIAIDGMTKTPTDNAAGGKNNDSNFGEPMEVDDSSYFCHNSNRQSQNMHEVVKSFLNSGTNLTYIVEKNDDKDLHLFTSEDARDESCKPMLKLNMNEMLIAGEPYEPEGNMTVLAQERGKCSVSTLGCGHICENAECISPRLKILDESVKVAEHQILQTADSISIYHTSLPEGEISPQPASQKISGHPAPLQATFDLSCIDKVDLSAERSQSYLVNPGSPQSSCSDLLEQIGDHRIAPRPSDRTTVSFKTPKQHKTVIRSLERSMHTVDRKQPAIATPLFKKSCIAYTVSRGTSTPVEGSARYVCPRYAAHHAVLTSHATQTGSGTPLSVNREIATNNASTPARLCLSRSAHILSATTTEEVFTRSRIPISTKALAETSQHGTPSVSSKQKALVDYELTPQSHLLNETRVLYQSTPLCRPLSRCSQISYVPMSYVPTTNEVSTPSRIPISTNALAAISQYGTPPSSKQNGLVNYELTPQSHVLSGRRTSWQEYNEAKPEHRRKSSVNSVTQIPLSLFAFEHLKGGGTPRPNSKAEKERQEFASGNSLLSVSKTPVTKPDISQMLVDSVMKSGPAYRRRPHPSKLLSPTRLQFKNSAKNSNLSSTHTSLTAEVTKEFPVIAQGKMDETQLVVIDSFDSDTMENLADDAANLSIADQQNVVLEEQKMIFDTTTNDYRKKGKTPVFDTRNYFGQRRILSILNDSSVSVNTPGKEKEPVVKMDPTFSGNPSDTSASPVHIIAAKDENKHSAILCPPKIVNLLPPEETGQGLRRSTRKRVAPIRHWAGEKAVYRRDEQGTNELVRVEHAIVKDPLFVKYNTIDMGEVIKQQKRKQRQHARARELRKCDRARRGFAEDDAKTSK